MKVHTMFDMSSNKETKPNLNKDAQTYSYEYAIDTQCLKQISKNFFCQRQVYKF